MKISMVIAIAYFLIAAIIGFILRSSNILDMPEWFIYPFLRHTHSHVALLGWLFASFYLIIVYEFNLESRKYLYLYGAMQICVFGMLISFPTHGYYLISIFFTSIHIILCYVFVTFLFKDFNRKIVSMNIWAVLFIKTAFIFLIISTLGTWGLGVISGMGMKGTPLYRGAIQFYLHFFFNGFFIFSALGVILNRLENHVNRDIEEYLKWIYIGFIIGTIGTFFHSINWFNKNVIFYLFNAIGAIVQLASLIFFLTILRNHPSISNKKYSKFLSTIIYLSLSCLLLKNVSQLLLVFPQIALVSLQVRHFIIGFVHLLMLGTLSSFVLAWLEERYHGSISRVGFTIFFIGVLMSEIILFGQGYLSWYGWDITPLYYRALTLFSLLMVIGVLIILCKFNFYKSKGNNSEI